MSRKAEIQVGLTVLVAIALLLWGITWLSSYARAQMQREWILSFPTAAGLAEGAEVRVNGVRKGGVKSLDLVGDHVIVEIALERDFQITKNSRVVIRTFGFMGDKFVAVDYVPSGPGWTMRDTIPGTVEKDLPEVIADVGHVTGSVMAISAQLDSLATALQRGGGVEGMLEDFRHTARQLRLTVETNRTGLDLAVANFSAASASARDLAADRRLREAIDHFASASENLDDLTGRLDSLRHSLQSVAGKLDGGEGTMARLVNDDKLYAELNASVRELQALIRDIKAQPKKYFKFSVF